MTSLRVRLAERRDAEALVALVSELNAHEGDPADRFTLEVCRRDWFGSAPAPFVVLLAEFAGAAVGYAVLSPDYESGWAVPGWSINDLYVREAARRRGVGRALMAAAAAQGRARGGRYLLWTAQTRNRRARAFYRRLGAAEEPIAAYSLSGEAFDLIADEGARR